MSSPAPERPIIEANGLTKTYALNSTPAARLADLLRRRSKKGGLDPSRVHFALNGIDLKIHRGEKVGIIGRNGAGKSTLLKLVTGVIQPTSGSLTVRGESHALLSLGAGFHPEFTGRDNAYAFLAHMGFSGRAADTLVEAAIDFAELEEFVDQPLKTYSTGMQARLMFAVSTALEPELLVIDEVLGVGDAYFQQKSFDRIRELCDSKNTTLLLVSHDIYQASKLVDRIVWVDRGQIAGDGTPSAMLREYENSIRLQEDARQKQKLAIAFRNSLRDTRRKGGLPPAFLEFRARNNEPAPSSVFFEAVTIESETATYPLPVLDTLTNPTPVFPGLSAQRLQHVAWGDVMERNGRTVRPWQNFGAVDHKAGFALFFDTLEASQDFERMGLRLVCATNDVVDADIVYVRPNGFERVLHRFISKPGETQSLPITLAASDTSITSDTLSGEDASPVLSMLAEDNPDSETSQAGTSESQGTSARQGSGRVVATGFELVGESGEARFAFAHGEPMTVRMGYHINDSNLREASQVVFAVRRNGVDDVGRVICRACVFDGGQPDGTLEAHFPQLPFGVGNYSITVLIAREGYYENTQGKFYAINPDVYDCRRDVIAFEVSDRDSLISHGTGAILNAEWTLRDAK